MILKKFRTHSHVNLLKPGETRFATQFIMLERLKVKGSKDSLIKTYIDPTLTQSVSNKSNAYKSLFECAKDLVFDPHFCIEVDYLCSILEPIEVLLRFSDNSLKIPVGFIGVIYYKYYLFTLKLSNFGFRNRNHMVSLANKRWLELHSPLHSEGFCVHPAYQGYDQHTNQDVWKEFLDQDVMDTWCDGATKKKILSRYTFYREKRSLFSTDAASSLSQDFDDPVYWWSNFGCEVPELQSFAMKAQSQSTSASPCETNWSL